MNRSFTSLALIGFTLAATAGYTVPAAAEPGSVATALVGSAELDASSTFDEVIFAAYPSLVGNEFVTSLKSGNLARAIATALNSDGDELELELAGELFVPIPELPVVSVGGSVAMKLTLSMRVLGSGQVVYELKGDGDKLSGGRLSGGPAGVEIGGTKASAITLQFSSRDALVAAIQTIVVGQAVGDQAENALALIRPQLTKLNLALAPLQAARNYFVGWLARYLPSGVVQQINAIQAARSKLQTRIDQLSRLAALADGAEQLFTRCPVSLEFELGRTVSASIGAKLLEAGGDSTGMLGIELESEFEPSLTAVVELEGGLPSRADLELHVKRSDSLTAGIFVTLAGQIERELVITGSAHFADGDLVVDAVSDNVELVVDRSYTAAAWAAGGAEYSAGRRTSVAFELVTMGEIGVEGVKALVAGEPALAAGLLAQMPVTFEGQARIERAISRGIGLELGEKWFAFGVNAAVKWTDAGASSEFVGAPTVHDLQALFTLHERTEQVQTTIDLLTAVAAEIGAMAPR